MIPSYVEHPQAEILLTFSADSGALRPPKSLLHSQFGLEAEVGIDPENSISDRKIAEFACQSTTIPHYPVTIFPLSFHSTLLAILLAITSVPETDDPVTGTVAITP